MSIELELQSIVINFLENKKYESFIAISRLFHNDLIDQDLLKKLYKDHYFFDTRLLDMSVYFLLHLSNDEQESLLLKWLEISPHLPERQKNALQKLFEMHLKKPN